MLKHVKKQALIVFISLIFISSVLAVPQAYKIPTVSKNKPLILTLHDAVFLALRNNPTIESGELDRVTQKYALIVARNEFEPKYKLDDNSKWTYTRVPGPNSYTHITTLTPSVGLKTGYGTQFDVSNINSRDRFHYTPSLTLKVTQPLIRGFGKAVVEAALNNAIDTERINRLNFKNTAIQTVSAIMRDYFGVMQSQGTLISNTKTLHEYEQTVKNDSIKIKSGQIARNDIVQDQAKVASQKATIQDNRNSLQQAKLTLLKDLGLPSDIQIKLPKKINFKTLENTLTLGGRMPNLKLCQEMAMSNNINYLVLGITLRTLRRALVTAKDQQKWQLDLILDETLGGASSSDHDNRGLSGITNHDYYTQSATLDLSIPIDDVDAKQTLLNARIGLEKAEIVYQDQRRQLQIKINDDRNTVLSNKRQLALAIKALKLQQHTLNIARMKHDAGIVSSFELNSLQQDLNASQQQQITSLINYLTAIETLDDDLGITLDLWSIKVRN